MARLVCAQCQQQARQCQRRRQPEHRLVAEAVGQRPPSRGAAARGKAVTALYSAVYRGISRAVPAYSITMLLPARPMPAAPSADRAKTP